MPKRATTIVTPPARSCVSLPIQPLPLRIRLVRKFAERFNGVELSALRVGDCLELPAKDAVMLITEGWAELVETPSDKSTEH